MEREWRWGHLEMGVGSGSLTKNELAGIGGRVRAGMDGE